MTLDDLCSRLLPPDEHLHFETLILEDHSLTLVAAMTAPTAVCPDCHQPSQRRHSGYPRTLADLPWALMPVALVLHVRRFFCDTSGCGRLTFTERLPTVAPLYARTTTRLRHSQAYTGLALGGSAGARQLARQSLPGSRNTVLRRVRSLSTPAYPPPHVVGIDDWAWRKGHRYGTIVVDLERGCPIDVLEDRLADTVAAWFKAHPEVNVVARDRAESYASGIRQGAPEAVQVADRFHLMQNVAAALEQVFSAHHQDLDALNEAQRQALVKRDDGSVAVPVPPPPGPQRHRQGPSPAEHDAWPSTTTSGSCAAKTGRQTTLRGSWESTAQRSFAMCNSPPFPNARSAAARGVASWVRTKTIWSSVGTTAA